MPIHDSHKMDTIYGVNTYCQRCKMCTCHNENGLSRECGS